MTEDQNARNLRFADSFVEFIRQRRDEGRGFKILNTILDHKEGYDGNPLHRWVRRDKPFPRQTRLLNPRLPGNYFAIRESKGLVSYTPRGKSLERNEDGTWSRTGRQSMAPGRWLRSILNPDAIRRLKLRDDELALIATTIKAEEDKHEILFGFESFEDGYNASNFAEEPDSCMFGEPVGEFYRAMGAKLLVAQTKAGNYRARAVFWPKVSLSRNGLAAQEIQLIDRIYADKPEVEDAMKRYARESGWWHKTRQSATAPQEVTDPEGRSYNDVDMNVVTESHLAKIEFYPYLDTFQSGSNSHLQNDDNGDYTYRDTHGARSGIEEGYMRDVNGDEIDEDDAVEIEGVYYHRESRYIVWDHNNEAILKENAVEINGEWYAKDDEAVVYSRIDSEYLLEEDAVKVETVRWGTVFADPNGSDIGYNEDDETYYYAPDCIVVLGKPYPKGDPRLVYSEEHEKHLLRSDAFAHPVTGKWAPMNDEVADRYAIKRHVSKPVNFRPIKQPRLDPEANPELFGGRRSTLSDLIASSPVFDARRFGEVISWRPEDIIPDYVPEQPINRDPAF